MSDEKTASALDPAMVQAGMGVRLENFEGPLDLLLYLIRKNDLDVYDIPIASITQEYLGYLELMKDLNLESAGEFLVMASTLMQIKAQMLLPTPEAMEDEGPDPRAELVNKLLEYQQFKEAASVLSGYNERAKDIYYRTTPPKFGEEDFTMKASVLDLLSAFKRILDAAPREMGQILREEIPLEVKIREVIDMLTDKTSLSFEELFPANCRRIDLIVTFMALLELIRLKQIVARQSEIFGQIRIYRSDAAPAEAPLIEEQPPEPQRQPKFFVKPEPTPQAETEVAPDAVATPEPAPVPEAVVKSEMVVEPVDVAAVVPEPVLEQHSEETGRMEFDGTERREENH